MHKIPPPTRPIGDPDRHLQCQDAIHIAVQDLVDTAVAAGWDEIEVAAALMDVADAHVLMSIENGNIDDLLACIKPKPKRS